MTNNQLTEQQIDLLIENGYDIAHTLENLAENEINSDCFEVFSYSENGRETEWDGKITEFAQRAAKAIRHLTDATTALQAELQERRKADSEPVAYTDEEELNFVNDMACMWTNGMGINEVPLYRHAQPAPVVEREPIAWLNDAYLARGVVDGEAGSEDAGPGYIPVYREAGPQPAPVITFYRDGIEAAAKWIDQQREAYDIEHGWSDPDTGAFEFGNDAQRGYSSTLEELAEGIRALHPNAGNSPTIPEGYVMVPMRLTAENGAKGSLSGEFSETKFVNCPECFGDDECETCDGSGRIEITVPVTWTTIKEIWAKGVEHFAPAPQEVK